MPHKQIRLANLRQLIQQEGAVSQLALRLQISPIYIYRVLDGKFNIGDSMARKIEDAYGFSLGWMDMMHELVTSSNAINPTAGMPVMNVSDQLGPLKSVIAQRTEAKKPTPAAIPERKNAARVTDSIKDENDLNNRLINGVITAFDRYLDTSRIELSDMEKAKLLMRVAERILDEKSPSDLIDHELLKKPVLKIS